MHLDEAIASIQNRLGLAELAPQEDGRYSLLFDGTLAVEITAGENGSAFFLEGAVGSLPGDGYESETLLKKLLQWNFVRMKSQRETLTLQPGQNDQPDQPGILLQRRLPALNLTEESLREQLEAFVNALEFWHKAVQGAPSDRRGGLPFLFP